MKSRWIGALLFSFFFAEVALAHGPKLGPNGGPVVHAGNYHVELVAKNTSLTVYLVNDADNAVDTKGYKATGIFVIDGKPVRIELAPSGLNKMAGQSTVALTNAPKGAVQIIAPSGNTAQAKFD